MKLIFNDATDMPIQSYEKIGGAVRFLTIGIAPEKLKAKLLFHVGNVLAHGSLGDKALFSRAGKIQTFCCADKIFQSSNIHKRASFCNRWKSKCNLRNYYNMIMIYCNIKNK